MKRERLKIRLSKLIDEYVGRAFILADLALRTFFPRRDSTPGPIRKILFIKFWGIGSIVLSEPALRWLKQAYPEAEIHYLTLARNRDLFGCIPWIEKVRTLAFRGSLSFLIRSLLLIRSLRREGYDLVLDGEFFVNFSGLVARWAEPRCAVGFSRKEGLKRRLQDVSITFQSQLHAAEQFLNLARGKATTLPQPPRPVLNRQGASSLELAFENRPYVVINVNASSLALERRWPRERFVRLGKSLLGKYDFDLVLIGSKGEMAYVAPLEQAWRPSRRVHNWTGLLNLPQLASLLASALLLVSNDSGPIHLASAFGVPVVGFYGPETPLRYGPLSPHRLVFYENLWCSPCMSVDNAKTVNCINNVACMKEIKTAHVIREVHQFIRQQVVPGAGPRRQQSAAAHPEAGSDEIRVQRLSCGGNRIKDHA
ncbi:MAG: glycosyltransferase family 9 protein [Acidobacteriota bacterium]